MQVDDTWRLVQNMIVDRSDVESNGAQLLHDRRKFVLQENQIAHNYRIVVIATECRPGAERKSRLNLDPSN